MEKPQFAVVQTKFETIEPEALSAVLQAHVRWPRADIQRLARKSRGILGTTFTDAEARGVCQALTQAGHPVRALETAKLLQLPRPRSVGWLDVAESALGAPLGDKHEAAAIIPWSSVFVIHATTMATEPEQVNPFDGGLVERNGARQAVQESIAELQPTLGLVGVAQTGVMIYVRLSLRRFYRQQMPWIPVGATREQQFRTVLGELIARSPGATVSPEARKMVVLPLQDVGRRTPTSQVLQDERTFQAEMNWLLQMLAFQHA